MTGPLRSWMLPLHPPAGHVASRVPPLTHDVATLRASDDAASDDAAAFVVVRLEECPQRPRSRTTETALSVAPVVVHNGLAGLVRHRWETKPTSVRGVQGSSQLSWAERRVAVRRTLVTGDCSMVPGRVVLVVDDISTSGATLRRAGQVLLQAGASKVYAICLAHTEG